MRRTWRWILGVLVAIVLLAVLVLWLLLRGSLAELDGERPLPGLASKVTVERDALGVVTITAGHTVEEMLQRDLDVEYHVRAALAKGMALCEQHGDFVSREILRVQLQDTEEDHAHWLEQQLGLIKRQGIQNYLTARLAEKPTE